MKCENCERLESNVKVLEAETMRLWQKCGDLLRRVPGPTGVHSSTGLCISSSKGDHYQSGWVMKRKSEGG
jgi:hypothetical protein